MALGPLHTIQLHTLVRDLCSVHVSGRGPVLAVGAFAASLYDS